MSIENKKGISIIDFPDKYIVMDFETTGFDRKYDKIIEMAALKVVDGEITDIFNTLVKPSIELDDYIVELTGITNEMLSDAPDLSEVMPNYIDFIGELPLVGHNISFDVGFLCQNTEQNINNNYIDTLRLSRKLYQQLEHHRLSDMIEYLNIDSKGKHRSLVDCENCLELLKICKREALLKYGTFENFANSFKKHRYRGKSGSRIDISKIVCNGDDVDTTNLFYDKECVFTGTLEKMKRADAMQLVVNIGGKVANSVTKKTNFLILGNNDYCSSIKDGKSSKQKKAEQLKLKGQDIEIISEQTFYDVLDI